MSWTVDDVKALGTGISGIGSGISAATSLASGIADAVNSTHSQRQARRQANRLKNDLTAIQDEYLAALGSNDDEYLNALQNLDTSVYDLSNYGYDTSDGAYNADDYMDKEANYIINQVVDSETGKSALGGLSHSTGALMGAANAAVAKSNELRNQARQAALQEKQSDLTTASTLAGQAQNAQDSYLSALEAVMNRNDDIASAKQSGSSSIATNYRSLMSNA